MNEYEMICSVLCSFDHEHDDHEDKFQSISYLDAFCKASKGELENVKIIKNKGIVGEYTLFVAAENEDKAEKTAKIKFPSLCKKLNSGDLTISNILSYKITGIEKLDHFFVKNKSIKNKKYTVYTNGCYDTFYITRDEKTDLISFRDLTKNYEVSSMSEATAQKGFDNSIFPEFYAPYISTETLIEYISSEKYKIEMFFASFQTALADPNSFFKSYPTNYHFENSEESTRIIFDGITETGDQYLPERISFEILDIPIAQFTFSNSKKCYDMQSLIELYVENADGKLDEFCENFFREIFKECKLPAFMQYFKGIWA